MQKLCLHSRIVQIVGFYSILSIPITDGTVAFRKVASSCTTKLSTRTRNYRSDLFHTGSDVFQTGWIESRQSFRVNRLSKLCSLSHNDRFRLFFLSLSFHPIDRSIAERESLLLFADLSLPFSSALPHHLDPLYLYRCVRPRIRK